MGVEPRAGPDGGECAGGMWGELEAAAASGGVRCRIADGGGAVVDAMAATMKGRATRGQVLTRS